MTHAVDPFRWEVRQAKIDDLRQRLARTRWPEQLPGTGWEYGTDKCYLQALCEYWRDGFDWQRAMDRFNAHAQFITEIAGEQVHFYHARSPEPDALPLIITHGFPGSVAEFLDIIGPLSDPARHGGDPRDAFHVVAPSIAGFGFSGPRRQAGYTAQTAAAANIRIMELLGYERYVAQGGDWGSAISTRMAALAPERVIGLHLNLIIGAPPDPAQPLVGLSERERAALAWQKDFDSSEMGYRAIQSTRPQSLAYGLMDSPAGLAGWIVEKFRSWSDCGDDLETAFSKDRLLENIGVYWMTGTINSAMRLYAEAARDPAGSALRIVHTPTGYAHFPREIRPTPRLWAEQIYANIVRWTEMPRGGHFAAMEAPADFVDELRAFCRIFR